MYWGKAILGTFVFLVGCADLVARRSQRQTRKVEWSYSGPIGPEHWGSLDPAFALCDTGKAQSPIDISSVVEVDDDELPPPRFSYQRSVSITMQHDGHTVHAEVEEPDGLVIRSDLGEDDPVLTAALVEPLEGALVAGTTEYSLLQFHFHAPSEHLLAGESLPMELHMVHRAADGSLAVVGVFIAPGEGHAELGKLFDDLPGEVGARRSIANFDLASLLPAEATSFRYPGSLTTPPCTEGVRWDVLMPPIELTAQQIQAFLAIASPHGNGRPAQELYGRIVQTREIDPDGDEFDD